MKLESQILVGGGGGGEGGGLGKNVTKLNPLEVRTEVATCHCGGGGAPKTGQSRCLQHIGIFIQVGIETLYDVYLNTALQVVGNQSFGKNLYLVNI